MGRSKLIGKHVKRSFVLPERTLEELWKIAAHEDVDLVKIVRRALTRYIYWYQNQRGGVSVELTPRQREMLQTYTEAALDNLRAELESLYA